MKLSKDKIYMDEEGYRALVKALKELAEKIKKVGSEKGKSASEATGDGWHDNLAF